MKRLCVGLMLIVAVSACSADSGPILNGSVAAAASLKALIDGGFGLAEDLDDIKRLQTGQAPTGVRNDLYRWGYGALRESTDAFIPGMLFVGGMSGEKRAGRGLSLGIGVTGLAAQIVDLAYKAVTYRAFNLNKQDRKDYVRGIENLDAKDRVAFSMLTRKLKRYAYARNMARFLTMGGYSMPAWNGLHHNISQQEQFDFGDDMSSGANAGLVVGYLMSLVQRGLSIALRSFQVSWIKRMVKKGRELRLVESAS